MRWKDRPRQPEEPQLGPELSQEHRQRLMTEHMQALEARDAEAEVRIRALLGPRRHVSAGDDWASPAT